MAAAGVKVVRDDASWGVAEPNPPSNGVHTYNFGNTDGLVTAFSEAHLTWLPVIDYTALWDASVAGDKFSPPADGDDFALFAQAIAARYGPGGSFWRANPNLPYEPVMTFEVWNEENSTFYWNTGPNPAAYASLYSETRTAIQAVDPTAQVLVGGLTEPTAVSYVTQMFQADPGLRGEVDGFSLHPYTATAAQLETDVQAFRSTVDTLGESAEPIDLTEFGWTVGATPTDESTRAQQMAAVASALGNSDCNVGLVAPFDWLNLPGDSTGDYSLSTGSSSLLPAGTAWFSGLTAAQDGPETTLCQPAGTLPAASSALAGVTATAQATPAPKGVTAHAASGARKTKHQAPRKPKHQGARKKKRRVGRKEKHQAASKKTRKKKRQVARKTKHPRR